MRGWRHDPGPCPVDDTPHTGCVAPFTGTQRTQTVTVPLARPGWVPKPQAAVEHAVTTFTTGTYKRAVHRRKGPR